MLGEILIAGIASLTLCMFLGPKFIEYLREKEFGQQIREEGPAGHSSKAGTPTMGGLIMTLSMAVPFLILGTYNWAALGVFLTAVASGMLASKPGVTSTVTRCPAFTDRWSAGPKTCEAMPIW